METVMQASVHGKSVLDERSFHLFEYQGDKLLYDISTGIVCELNGFSYELLSLCGKYELDEILRTIDTKYPDVTEQDIYEVLEPLESRGLFSHRPVEINLQQRNIDSLWRHRPRRIQLFLAQSCNLACRYCYAENNRSNAKHMLMSWDVAKAAVNYFVKSSGNRRNLQVTFFGGEPLLNLKVLKQVVGYCEHISKQAKKKFIFELVCNGTLLNKEVADYVAERDFLLFISIDGNREMHNYQRPSVDGTDYYDTILKNAKYVVRKYRQLKSRHKVKIRANMTPKFHDVRKIAKYLESQGFNKIGIAAIQPMPFGDCTPCALSEQQLDKLDEEFEKIVLEALSALENGEKLSPHTGKLLYQIITRQLRQHNTLGIICGIGRNTNAVDCLGNIFPCHRFVGLDKYILGNIYESLSPSKTIGLYNKYNEVATSQCSECWARNFCGGGCPWERSVSDGQIYEKTSSMCNRIKKSIERGLWLDKEIRKRCPERYAAISRSHGKDDKLFNSWRW
jgi:uncharacterized protein